MVLPTQFDEALRIPRSIWSNLFGRRGTGARLNADSARARHQIDMPS
jgi:hypothetical protein